MTKRPDFSLILPPSAVSHPLLERCKKELLDIKNDNDGRAHAYLCTMREETPHQREEREHNEVYAWVRAQGTKEKTVQVVSVFIPCKEFSASYKSRARVEDGYQALGLIDNYFLDVFGFVHPDRTQDKSRPVRYFQGSISRYAYITRATAEEMAARRAQEGYPLYLSKTKKETLAYMEESIAWLQARAALSSRPGGPSFS